MLDVQLRRIVPKSAGTYFIVRDNSQVEEIENESKMRLFFINVEQGPINMAISFAQGDKTGFQSVFGKSTRAMKKKGNFSIDTCLDALDAGPITVVNLRAFDDTKHKCQVTGMNMNGDSVLASVAETPYRKLFTTNTFWTPNYSKMNDLVENTLLTFGNVGSTDFSIIVTVSNEPSTVTAEGNLSLLNCSMEIDEYPALDFNMLVKDTIVDVYLFNNTFDKSANTNPYYGNCFDENGYVSSTSIEDLCNIPEAGFVKKFTGSVIPNLKNEQGDEISINTVLNQYFMETGLICDINDDIFEIETPDDKTFIDGSGYSLFDKDGNKIADNDTILSHVIPEQLTIDIDNCDIDSQAYRANVEEVTDNPNQFIVTYGKNIRYGDAIYGKLRIVHVTSMEVVDDTETLTDDTKILVTCDGTVDFEKSEGTVTVLKFNNILKTSMLKFTNLSACKPTKDQFLDGTAKKQNEILDMMNDPGIVKGLCGIHGLRYIVDCFKSYIESSYKYQYGQLVNTLDGKNRFVRAILNDVFVKDLQESKNPLFSQTPTGPLDLSFLIDGGNKNFSTKLLTKFATGSEFSFFFGPENIVNNIEMGIAGKVSNLFYQKTNAFDVVANTTGIVDGITELGYPFDDDDRMYCEKFRYNPIINLRGSNRIYGNLTAKESKTAQQQITNSELLAYIKEQLYNMAMTETFKRGTYDDYLRTETQSKNFLSSLALAGVIDADFVCECNSKNNTLEIRKQKIKLVHIEYTPVDVLEKVVFDLTIN